MVKSDEMADNIEQGLQKAKDELQNRSENEMILGHLLRFSSQPFGIGYPNGRLGLVNKAFEQLTGYTEKELKSSDWSKTLTPPEFREMEREKLEELQNTDQSVRYEKEYVRKDGTRVPIQLLVHLVKHDDGTPLYYSSFITDISERKKSEDALNASEKNYRHLIQYAPTAIYEIDYIGPRFKSVNDGMCKLSGYSKDELLSMNPLNLLDSESKKLFKERLRKIAAGEEIDENVEFKVIHKNGRKLWVILNVKPTFTDGKVDGALVVGYDITKRKELENKRQELLEQVQLVNEELTVSNEELKSTTGDLQIVNEELVKKGIKLTEVNRNLRESEEKFYKAFHANPAAMTLSDEEGRWIDVNESFMKLTGYRKEELIGNTSAELNIIESDKRQPYITELQDKGLKQDIEMEIRTKSGEKRVIISNSELIELESEIRFISFIYDITTRKEREILGDALNKVNAYINSTLDYDEIMQLIVEEGTKAIGAESSVINIKEEGNWIVKFVYNFPDDIIGQRKSDHESPTSVHVANKKKAVAFNDAPNDPRVNRNGMKLHGVASLLASPIILKDQVKAIIVFYHHQKSVVFSEAQIDFTNKLASSLSQAIENAQLFDEMKNSEERYHSLYSSMNEGVALHEIIYNSRQEPVDYVITDINPAYENITGLKKSAALGMKASQLYGTDAPPYMEIYASVAETGESTEFETYFEPMNIHFHISVVSPGKGKFATIFEDITKRKQAEEDLKRQAALLDVSYEAIFSYDYDGGIVSWNQGAERLYGYTDKDAIGNISHDLLKTHFPIEFNEFEKILINDKMWTGELTHTTKTGEKIIVESRQQLIQDNSGRNIVIETNRDITERKKAEEELTGYRHHLQDLVKDRTAELEDAYESLKESEAQYLTLFNSIDEGFCTIEVIFDDNDKPVDYRFLEINPAFENQTGLKDAEGKLMRDLAPNHEEHWFEIYGKIALTGKPMRFQNPAKELNRWYDVYAFKIGDPESREVAILFNDITKRKKIENELKEYQDNLEEKVEKRTEELEKSNAELEQFAYVSSHDLQEPLRMVTSFTQLLERRYKYQMDEDADEYIDFIVEGAHRMKYLIDDLLAFSRVSSRAKEFENLNLEKVLNDVLSNLSVSINENNASVNHDPLPIVTADPSQIRQVFQNLIGNAIKFHGTKQPKIHITAQQQAEEWILAVADNGIGIDPEYQKQIFDVFKRLHTRADYPGSGIGLSISQKIIKRHGGNIWVESEQGKGSTFYFTIPKTQKSIK